MKWMTNLKNIFSGIVWRGMIALELYIFLYQRYLDKEQMVKSKKLFYMNQMFPFGRMDFFLHFKVSYRRLDLVLLIFMAPQESTAICLTNMTSLIWDRYIWVFAKLNWRRFAPRKTGYILFVLRMKELLTEDVCWSSWNLLWIVKLTSLWRTYRVQKLSEYRYSTCKTGLLRVKWMSLWRTYREQIFLEYLL